MACNGWAGKHVCCRSPHGERGLKYFVDFVIRRTQRRSPHGERGLKSDVHVTKLDREMVALLTESVD